MKNIFNIPEIKGKIVIKDGVKLTLAMIEEAMGWPGGFK